ncbi:hypothetical protein ACSBR2_021272 [Camellia fascicularis]
MLLLSLKRLVMLKMLLEVAMAMILMGTGYGWSLHMEVVEIHHQSIVTVVTAVGVVPVVECPDALNIAVCISFDICIPDHMRRAGDVCFSQVFRDGSGTTGIVDYTNYDDMKYAIRKLDDSEFRNAFTRAIVRVREYKSSRSRSQSRSRSYSRSRSRSRSYSRGRSYSRSRSLSQSRSRSKSPRAKSARRSPAKSRSRSASHSRSGSKPRSLSRSPSRSGSPVPSRQKRTSESPKKHSSSRSRSRSRSKSLSR